MNDNEWAINYQRHCAGEMIEHEKKCWTEIFEPIHNGLKSADVRKNDADYRAGDTLLMREYTPGENDKRFEKPADGTYTGAWLRAKIKHVLGDNWPGIETSFCVLSLDLGTNYSGFDPKYAGMSPSEINNGGNHGS